VSVTFPKEPENLFIIHIQGTLTFEDLNEVQNEARTEIDRSQKVKLVILAGHFTGWGEEGGWGDLTFMYEYDPYIEKIAIVADQKWREQILMFIGAGRRQATVEFFLDAEELAQDWHKSQSC
jgi:MFS superfamily sulfate permease-like transporter